jgi:hypothetical protein
MHTQSHYDRRDRFNSSGTELWNIAGVFSHPPSRREPPCRLEDELLRHGYQNEMWTVDGRDINCFVQDKAAHPRHVRMIDQYGEAARLTHDELLAIACYTGVDAYRDVRRSAAARNWDRWPSFIENLIRGLQKLQTFEMLDLEPSQPLFHGISNAIAHGQTYFGVEDTFWLKFMMPISTSPDRDLALSFLEPGRSSNSLLLRFEAPFRDETYGRSMTYFADISWISQFPLEREVLVFPVGDCMGGKLLGSFDCTGCNVQEFSAAFSGDW